MADQAARPVGRREGLWDRSGHWLRHDLVPYAKAVWQEFTRDNGMLVAAAISFFVFLSLFPLLLAAIGILGLVLGSPANAQQVILGAASGFVAGPQMESAVTQIVHGGSAATGVGLILLVWAATGLMLTLESALDVVWGVEQRHGFVRQRARALLLFFVLGGLLGVSVAATGLVNWVTTGGVPLFPHWGWVSDFFSYLVPVLISIAAFTLMYKLLPNADVSWRAALTGGVFAGILWEIAKQAFTFYVINFADYSKVYGSLAGVILLLVWIDYSAIIVVLGAEIASYSPQRRQQANLRQARAA